MTTLGHVVSVQEVVCEFGGSTGWQAVLKIYENGNVREIKNTVWSDYYSALHDRDAMSENIDMWLNA